MKNIKSTALILLIIVSLLITSCTSTNQPVDSNIDIDKSTGAIYLYGEEHGIKVILDEELELWGKHYDEENMRHLFVELSYYAAEFLNLWMDSESNEIMEELYEDWKGTMAYNQDYKEFYENIKRDYPETIFYGTDVGHQYDSTGERYLRYLEENNMKDTDTYLLAEEAIEQGRNFYKKSDNAYRENKMTENFIREFDKLDKENIMGIYGGAHTDFKAMAYNTKSTPSMAKQLKKHYGDNIHSEDLSWMARVREPERIDTITINGKDYTASYFGEQDLTGFKDYSHREFWRLEDAYENFKDSKKNGNVLPYDNYPISIKAGQVFVIDHTRNNGSVERSYYISSGHRWKGMDSTEEIILK